MHENRYKDIIQNHDERKLWKEIDWSGKHTGEKKVLVPIKPMADYFEILYEPPDRNELAEMNDLKVDLHIPVTDDPITDSEVQSVATKKEKGRVRFTFICFESSYVDFITIFGYVYE